MEPDTRHGLFKDLTTPQSEACIHELDSFSITD